MRQNIRQKIQETIFTVLCVVIATGATVLVRRYSPLGYHAVFSMYLAAVAIAAWRGGAMAAALAMGLSLAAALWCFIPPLHSFHVNGGADAERIGMFLLVAIIIGSFHSARDRAEKKLQESERRLRFSLDASGVGCWDAEISSGAFWKSHNLAAIFGRSDAAFATTYEGFFAYIYPEDREFFHLASIGSGSDQRDYEISHRIIRGDGSIDRVTTRGRMYLDSEGRVERMVGAVYADNKGAVQGLPPGRRAAVAPFSAAART